MSTSLEQVKRDIEKLTSSLHENERELERAKGDAERKKMEFEKAEAHMKQLEAKVGGIRKELADHQTDLEKVMANLEELARRQGNK